MAVLVEGCAAAGGRAALEALGPGARALWLGFEGPSARAALAAEARARGVTAELLPAFGAARAALAAWAGCRGAGGPRAATVRLAWPEGGGGRFLAELWPLPEGVVARPWRPTPPAWSIDGRRLPAPVRQVEAPGGRRVLGLCGWLWVEGGAEGPAPTGLETALHGLFDAAGRAGGPGRGPWFGELRLRVEADFEDGALAEAVHEELYFGALEALAARAGARPGDRTLRPGKVVPEVVHRPGAEAVLWRAETRPARPARGAAAEACDPAELDRPPREGEVWGALAALGGREVAVRSGEGRRVRGRALPGAGPAVVVAGGQHANEPTGVVGALLAARAIGGALGVAPLENPDGWALYAHLRRDWPEHMHHAARYAASGADLAHVTGGEGELRRRLAAETGAALLLSLHGYPARAWLRPFTGGLPAGFEDWALPRGVFLILRARPGWEGVGRAAVRAAAAALNRDGPVTALNRAQWAAFRRAAPGAAAPARIGDVGVIEAGAPGGAFPVEIVTEAPDETVLGARFRLLVRAQVLAATAAARAWRGRGR